MKKSFTKKIATLTAAAMCICMVSCGGSDESSKTETSKATAAPEVTLPASSDESSEDSSSAEDNSSAEDTSADENEPVSEGEYSPAMWLVTSPEGETMYMMGSMHALREECYPLPDYVQSAYEQADVLAVECDITDATATFSAGMTQMENLSYEDGTTLKDHLPEELYEDIKGYLKAHDIYISTYDENRLWYLNSVLESVAVTDAKLDTTLGLDTNLLDMAHEDGKEIYEVESVSFQVDMIIGFSDDIYRVAMEGYSEENIDLLNEQYEELYKAWRTGDLSVLEEQNDADSELTEEEQALADEYNKQMLYDRNIGMAEKAEQLMADGKNVLYVVGAAHFVGDGGIIDLMTEDGYTFELVNG